MSIETRQIYRSANGDRWSLAREPDRDHVFVRHEPNSASGGHVSELDLGTFLSQSGMGPEKRELLRLIGSLVEQPARR